MHLIFVLGVCFPPGISLALTGFELDVLLPDDRDHTGLYFQYYLHACTSSVSYPTCLSADTIY